ncbi:PREDICTED: LOW QUALITY PROTEIN: uncharacterized protein C5orf64 homolog [Propithecus coquereli]|uniref:LOW QUALITY PROTEIN: uncharacterized protein C5orf64 homolog n=1 Tax=Propithecus coquereli TaxID=379532 RepID=UPI00063F8E6B|nr:PREDICTED: LOW QUALITY PROTEIN: uncharacterized protein C5orf64 homolog [Propithecus coquereli]
MTTGESKLEPTDSNGVFRNLISVQPPQPQLGRVNMYYSESPYAVVETDRFKQNAGLTRKDLATEVYFPSVKFRSHLPEFFYVNISSTAKCVGEYESKKGQERQTRMYNFASNIMLSRLAGCFLKSTKIRILGIAM